MNRAELFVAGIPQPQGNKTGFVQNGRAVLVEGRRGPARAAFKDWRSAVSAAASAWVAKHDQPAFDGPLYVELELRFPLPKGDQHRVRHTTKPDIDKLERSVLDALKQGGLIADDARVYSVRKAKVYARGCAPGAFIVVESHAHLEADDRELSKTVARAARKAS